MRLRLRAPVAAGLTRNLPNIVVATLSLRLRSVVVAGSTSNLPPNLFFPYFYPMADKLTAEQRSRNMAAIKSKNTKPEILVRKFLHANGYRYKLHDKTLFGKPDIVLPKYKTIIFVHGCFWHGHHNCKYATIPKTRTEWWTAKINRNKKTDKINTGKLRKEGWKIITVWECSLKKNKLQTTFNRLLKQLI